MHGESASADPRRRAALALARVDAHGAHAARLLGGAPGVVRELVLGVLRWQLTLDHLLAPHLRQPLAALDAEVRALLRVGLYEALRLATPAAVAVSEAVRVAKELAPRASGLVNAVLRRAVQGAWPAAGDPTLPLCLRTSHPEWLVKRWIGLLGEEGAAAALAADQEPAPLCLLAAVSHCGELWAAGCGITPHPCVAGVAVVGAHAELAAAALEKGRAYAMDSTAVMVARLLPEVAGMVVDLTAAPGGKSLVLASERPGIRLVSADRRFGRVVLMRGNLRLTTATPRVIAADATAPSLRAGSCAAVLLDAPCSGTGTLRRHPEIRWRLQPADFAPLAAAQRRLAQAAAELLAPGGWLLYATCSLEGEENGEVVTGLPLERVAVTPRLPGGVPCRELPTGGVVIPPYPGGDGHSVHLLRRAK